MITLGIETSCDETALSLLETRQNEGIFEYRVLGNIVHSQVEMHKEYGGVYPNLAKREHIKNLPILFKKILDSAKISEGQIDSIAVTQGPGLEPALWTGITFAQELGSKNSIPVIPVNHMEGHIVSTLLASSSPNSHFEKLKPLGFPALALLISGGHTELVAIQKIGSYKILGRTRDDAVGEAFDKVARMLGLPYPGGPEVGNLALQARQRNLPKTISLPRPMIASKDFDFSFSGLKTAVLYTLKKIAEPTADQVQEISREFEDAITDILISKTTKALDENEYRTLIIGGGVIANTHLRQTFELLAGEYDIPLYLPASGLTGDNALMIALVAAIKQEDKQEKKIEKSPEPLRAQGNLSLSSAI